MAKDHLLETDPDADPELPHPLSQDPELDRVLKSVVTRIRQYAEEHIRHLRRQARIGIALSSETNIDKLLEMILDEAREISRAEAGTLYLLDKEEQHLLFRILHNDVLDIRLGGTSGKPITLPSVPLYKSGQPNYSNVSSYVALTGEVINIADVYKAEGFDFTGTRNYDAKTGYRSKSMLVMAMKNHEGRIIGVLQLFNARDPQSGEIVAFTKRDEEIVESLTSQAGVALTKNQLIQDLRNLFYAFIQSIAAAIDAKSPYTGGHIRRVVDLTMLIARTINEATEGPFQSVQFSETELEELRLAAWMHDVGKVTTPEYVVDKSTKLETIFDRIELIRTRFQTIEASMENAYLKQKIQILESGKPEPDVLGRLENQFREQVRQLHDDLRFIESQNASSEFMPEEARQRICQIGSKTYLFNGKKHTWLIPDEVENLCIQKGTLNPGERELIEDHAKMTLKILQELPFPSSMSRVAEYAAAHHEKLDGTGYPLKLSKKHIPIQARIMAVADVFEALTAKDRPYKKPMKLSQALEILQKMKTIRHIDPDICDLFIQSKLYAEYAQREMEADQVDI